MVTQFDFAQSFYVDKNAVDGAAAIHITSIDLYFLQKPDAGASKTGIYKPGVSVYLCPMKNEQPDVDKVITTSRARVEWDSIVESEDASTSTKFTFTRPVLIATDAQYAFLVSIDGSDNDFKMWWGQSGDNYVNTNVSASLNSGYNDGNFYQITNGNVLTKTASADLKFKVNIAKFSSLSSSFVFDEKPYELFKYFANSITGNFKTGEYVYKNTSPQTGNAIVNSSSLTVTGSGTSYNSVYAAGDYVVFSDGTTGNTFIRVVSSVTNSTSMVIDELPPITNATGIAHYKTAVAKVYMFDKKSDHLILSDSNANSTYYFANNDFVKGEDSGVQTKIESMKNFDLGRVTSQFNVVEPGFTSTNTQIMFANSLYDISGSSYVNIPIAKRQFVDAYDAIIGSKSLIAANTTTNLFSGNVSVNGALSFTTTNKYTSPYIEESDLDILVYRYIINNDATDEEKGSGNASSRYISKKVTLGNEQEAEDLRVYVNVYQPTGTSIKLYGKLISAQDYETADQKNWTPLEEVNPITYTSSSVNKNDTVEKEFRIPFYHNDGTALSGYGSITTPNTIITTTSDLSGNVTASSSLVRVYQEGSPNNFFVSLVTAANSSSITVADTVSNTSFNGAVKIELVSETNKNSAFINPQNRNVVRYYTADMSPLDTYNQFLIKIVLLSENTWRAPLVKDVRAIAVSA